MSTDGRTRKRLKWWQYWPAFVGGFFELPLGWFLARWLPLHFAMATAGFIAWFFVGMVWLPIMTPRFGIPRWLIPVLMGAIAGLIVGLLSYWFPWR